jgi:hypothetical protein
MELEENFGEKSPALTAAQYWEWRTTISEMNVAQEKFKTSQLEVKLLQKEAENLAVRTQLLISSRVRDAKEAFEASRVEYERFKKFLEEATGTSLNNKVIDDITFEIKDIPDENTTQKQEK